MSEARTCEWCGKDFVYRNSETGKRFCSAECYNAKRSANALQPCPECGVRSATKKAAERHIERVHRNPRPSVLSMLKCAHCGGPVSGYQQRYCSSDCRKAGRIRTGSANPNWKGGLVEVICETCGNEFSVRQVRGSLARFCSWKCVTVQRKGSSGYRGDVGMFFRSRWEANYARVLRYWESQGQITAWTYESDTFPISGVSGVRSYTPDFKVWYPDSRIEFHEIKGHADKRSLVKREWFERVHTETPLQWIDRPVYRAIEADYKWLPGWEQSGVVTIAQSPMAAMRRVAKTNGFGMFQVGADGEVWIVMRPEKFAELIGDERLEDFQAWCVPPTAAEEACDHDYPTRDERCLGCGQVMPPTGGAAPEEMHGQQATSAPHEGGSECRSG